MKRNKKVILLLAFLSLFVSMYFIQDTYAKYLTRANTDVTGAIARWNIVVNDEVIRNGDTLDNLITPIFVGSQHIKEDVIAPTVTGYFDLQLDASDVDVSFTYNISVARNANLRDFVVTGYQVDSGTTNSVDVSVETPTISDDILITDTTRTHTIRVFIGWNDDADTQELNNAQDTTVTGTYDNINLTVNLSFVQKAS